MPIGPFAALALGGLVRLTPRISSTAARLAQSGIQRARPWVDKLREAVSENMSPTDIRQWLTNATANIEAASEKLGSGPIKMLRNFPKNQEALLNSLTSDVTHLNNPATRALLEGSNISRLHPADKYATFMDLMRGYKTPYGQW